jgi:hypothetical protein
VGLERRALSLVSTIEELLGRKNSGFVLESREYGRRDPSRCPRIRKKLVLTSTISGCRSFGIVRSRTQAMEFSCFFRPQSCTQRLLYLGTSCYKCQCELSLFEWLCRGLCSVSLQFLIQILIGFTTRTCNSYEQRKLCQSARKS